MIGTLRRLPGAGAIALAASLLLSSATSLAAQDPASGAATDPLSAALAHEDAGRFAEAAGSYRLLLNAALADGTSADQIALALLGLERVWQQAAMRDSIVPVVQAVLAARPSDPIARSIQFRALSGAARDVDLHAAFMAWRDAAPAEAAPWREYVRTLMAMGRPLAADSVLAQASEALGGRRELASEVAQIAATLERWNDAAHAWRTAVEVMPYLEMAATFSLQRTPEAARDSVRRVLLEQPNALLPRRLLATLETTWGDPRAGWAALASARTNDSTLLAWSEFGERAEATGAWSVARDVWRALFDRVPDAATGRRAAQAALSAGAPAEALELSLRAGELMSPQERAQRLLMVDVEALGALGRAEEAAKRVRDADRYLDDALRADLAKPLVTAWLRAGDVARAREVALQAGALDDDQTIGWLALYDGDLVEARRRLVRAATRDAALTDALAVLARTRVERHTGLGEAVLALARQDTANAVARFAAIADSLDDAAPALLAMSARLATLTGTSADAVRYWKRILSEYASAPEVPEALLEIARALERDGDIAGATARYESLLIDHPGSAMVPQARRELERLRGRIPEAA